MCLKICSGNMFILKMGWLLLLCSLTLVLCDQLQGTIYWDFFGDLTLGYPEARQGHSLVGVDYPILFGGMSDSGPLNDTYRFINGSWVAFNANGDAPCPRSEHAAGLIGSSMIIFGGWGRIEQYAAGCTPGAPCPVLAVTAELYTGTYVLDIPKATWRMLPTRTVDPAPRRGACAAVVGSSMYLFGGHGSTRLTRLEPESFVTNQLYR